MRWIKQGLLYSLEGSHDWRRSHTQLPIVDTSNENHWRIYFSSRNSDGRSLPLYIDVEAGNPANVLRQHNEPLLQLGERGRFDEHGVMPTAVIDHGGDKFLYYIGWSLQQSVPYRNAIGLAISVDGGDSYTRFADGPLIAQDHIDPVFTGTLNIMAVDGVLHGYYMSCTDLHDCDGNLEPRYHIRYARSSDGISWQRDGHVCIDYLDDDEGGLVGASTLQTGDYYHMWYCRRSNCDYRDNTHSNNYRIGYARSVDGYHWQRLDADAGIDISNEGWDAEMICYPHVVRHADTLYMFYNGNGFGQSGIGYATCDAAELT